MTAVTNKEQKSRTLYVTDLDGTLMRGDKTISAFTVDTLNRLIEQGMLITYATARSFHSAWEITKDVFQKDTYGDEYWLDI